MKKILVCVASAVVMLTGLAAPAHAAKRPKTYSCQAIQGDVIVSSVGFITKKQANTFKKPTSPRPITRQPASRTTSEPHTTVRAIDAASAGSRSPGT